MQLCQQVQTAVTLVPVRSSFQAIPTVVPGKKGGTISGPAAKANEEERYE
jgi:hypothetical protein